MPTLVVPFRGTAAKSRLEARDAATRQALADAMLADVVAACAAVGPTFVVAPAGIAVDGAQLVGDPGGGQGAAVRVALDAAVAAGAPLPYLVVNADLPCVTPRDLLALAGATPADGLALAAAADGTTNALALAGAELFEPLYGPGSAERYEALGPSRRVEAPNLIDDVDTVADLERLAPRLGPQTRAAAKALHAKAAA
jgi:2-phospho-L-lactate guanylyltransferase